MKEILEKSEHKMGKTLQILQEEFASLRAGRANPAVLDKIMVNYYETPTPINQLAAVSVSEARVLIVQPWDTSVLHMIEKAIQTSDLGINPNNDGRVIRLVFPALNEERRRDLVKEINKTAENAKVSIRAVRRDAIEKLKAKEKTKELTEDDLKQAEKKIQDLTDKYCKDTDKIADKKETEIMEI